MQKRILIGFCCMLLSICIFGLNTAFAGQPNPNLELIPKITLDGSEFTLQNVPHDQASTLNYVNIPINLGVFQAPVTVNLQNASPDIEYVSWHVTACSETTASSKYYIEPISYNTITRTQNEIINNPGTIYYESANGYDFNATFDLAAPNCYSITMKGSDEQTGDSNEYNNIYFIVISPSGYLDPDFDIEYNHSNISIFDEALNETPTALAPEFITLTDTTNAFGSVSVASREWSIEWFAAIGSDRGSAVIPIPSGDKTSSSFSYNFNNPGFYKITLKVTGTNGSDYSKSLIVLVQDSNDYFPNVLQQRDAEHKNFTSFNATVASISDSVIKNLYNTVLDACSMVYTQFDATSGGWGMQCTANAQSLMDNYDSNLFYLDVPCSHFPDLSGYNSHDELCRAAYVVKDIDAFEGDGPGSPTAGYLRPDSNINRAEICAVLNKSKISTGGGAAVPATVANSAYSDLQSLADDDWRKTNAAGCTQFEGYPDGTFRPGDNINTVETLKVLFLIYGETVDANNAQNLNTYCPLLSESEWYAKYLALAFQNGFMDVVTDNCNPGKMLTRGEVVMLMYKMFFEYAYIPAP